MTIAHKNVRVILTLKVFIELPSCLVHLAHNPVGIITDSERPDKTIIGSWLSVFSYALPDHKNVIGEVLDIVVVSQYGNTSVSTRPGC
ncbi:MAG TPA: hypothetical protein VKV40_10385 [Ktedonobacteraceae bacterium]|nr:hypothetical protein [Ktedonobacteraceae bacterium]